MVYDDFFHILKCRLHRANFSFDCMFPLALRSYQGTTESNNHTLRLGLFERLTVIAF